MYPLTCPDGTTEHEFEEGPGGLTCGLCRLHSDVYLESKKEYESTQASIKTIVDILNHHNKDFIANAVYEEMRHTHRTLQQSFMGMLAAFIGQMKEMETDGRNKDSVEWCKKVDQIDKYFPSI